MKDNSWNDELLDDVLAAGAPPSLREDSLAHMLGAVQRRRQQRQQVRAILATTCFVALVGLAIRFVPARTSSTRVRAALQVSSHHLAPDVIVATRPGTIEMVGSVRESVPLVEPLSGGDLFEFIGDD